METEIIPKDYPLEPNVDKKTVALESVGITRPVIYQVLKEGLLATKTRTSVDDDGEEQTSEEPDHNTRHKFLDTALRVMGDLKGDAMVDNRKVTINTSGVKESELSSMLEMFKGVKEQLASMERAGKNTGEVT